LEEIACVVVRGADRIARTECPADVILPFNRLPAGVPEKIGTENVAHIYGDSVAQSVRAAKTEFL
jgi:hypothetical protein